MAVRNLKIIKPIVWVPPTATTAYKIVIERADGTLDDISKLAHKCVVEDYVTDSIGRFEFEIYDPNGTFFKIWNGNEIFRYYKDYAATATTLMFRGRIEKPSKTGYKLKVKGRGESLRILNVVVSKSYVNVECSAILKDLMDSYASWATYTGVETSNTSLTVNWYDKPMNECVQELCEAAGFDFYIDASLDAQFFEVNSRENTTDAILHNYNLFSLTDFTPDFTQIRNKIRVYGSDDKGMQIIYTAKQVSGEYGITTLGERSYTLKDSNITSFQQAKEIADYTLSQKINPPIVGEITGFLLSGVLPGDKVKLSSPNDGIVPGLYNATGYKDEINLMSNVFSTTLYINKVPRTVHHVIRDRIIQENKDKGASLNPYGHDYSYIFLFNEDSGTHSDTEISDGALRLAGAASSGFWTSPTRQTTNSLSEVYLSMNGTALNNLTVSVSTDGGTNYYPIQNT